MSNRGLVELAKDRTMTRHQLRVLLFLMSELDVDVYRPIKQAHVADVLRSTQPNVSTAIAALISRKFIECGPDMDNGTRTYRLNMQHPYLNRVYTQIV